MSRCGVEKGAAGAPAKTLNKLLGQLKIGRGSTPVHHRGEGLLRITDYISSAITAKKEEVGLCGVGVLVARFMLDILKTW